mmetsp:Transcript_9990/g.25382  ORF Transcript_9990/g.25382 Transcript_9990/m.25382 type:complete len:202 (+) Transcript_9990:41-646(+)
MVGIAAVVVGLAWATGEAFVLAPSRPPTTRLDAKAAKYYKANGDPIKPAVTGYMHFCADERSRVSAILKTTLGEAYKPTDVMVKLGELWRGLDGKTLDQYKARAAADKERYVAEMAAAGHATGKPEKKKSTRPKSAYLHFCNDARAKITDELRTTMGSDFKPTAVMKVLGARWQSLDAATKLKYQAKAAEEKALFQARGAP